MGKVDLVASKPWKIHHTMLGYLAPNSQHRLDRSHRHFGPDKESNPSWMSVWNQSWNKQKLLKRNTNHHEVLTWRKTKVAKFKVR